MLKRHFKRLLAAIATVVVLATPALSQPSLDISVLNRHSWRGQPSNNSVSIQPELAVQIGEVGTTASVWSNFPLEGKKTEYDLTLSQIVGDVAKVSVISYYYNGPFLDVDNHDIEVGVSSNLIGIGVYAGRFISGDKVKDDTWLNVSYTLSDSLNIFAGVGNGNYVSNGDGMSLVLLGVSTVNSEGYSGTLQYNVDTETPLLIVGKSW